MACSTSLHHIIQSDNKPLRQYLMRFNKVCLNILNLNPVVAMHSLMVKLHLGIFLDSLDADPPKNMNVLCVYTLRYISIEENTEARKRKAPQGMMAFTGQSTGKKRPNKFESYTPLNTSRDTVLQEACNLELVYYQYWHLLLQMRTQQSGVVITRTSITPLRTVRWYMTSLKNWFVLEHWDASVRIFNRVKDEVVVAEGEEQASEVAEETNLLTSFRPRMMAENISSKTLMSWEGHFTPFLEDLLGKVFELSQRETLQKR